MKAISKATVNNWAKLNSNTKEKLSKRANKTRSTKHIVATSYLNFAPATLLLSTIATLHCNVEDVMYTLCIDYLRHANILEKENVKRFLATLPCYKIVEIDVPAETWDSNHDVLGFIYQSLITEGERNITGQYYTSRKVVEYMLRDKVLNDGETFLDPCCGSGAFLLAANTNDPSCLYGFDINPVAVMLAGTNLLVKYPHHNFTPHVYCVDFLQYHRDKNSDNLPSQFDNIYTNPPWGTDKLELYKGLYPEIKSRERCSMVIIEALKRLNNGGNLFLLLPTSLLKTKSHSDIRKYILSNAAIKNIDLFSDRFDGVYTDYFSIRMSNCQVENQEYEVFTNDLSTHITLSLSDKAQGKISTQKLSTIEKSIIQKVENRRHDDLHHSHWALGIITGDNKSKLKQDKAPDTEAIYTGRQVKPFLLDKPACYINFAPATLQQCAKEELYRASEKLIYRFIARYPIVAYDDRQRLCLNSANILIPQLQSISIKSAAAILNSTLYRYYYSTKFSDIKVLKSNLQQLPFPKLTLHQDKALSRIVTTILTTHHTHQQQLAIDKIVYKIFGITKKEQTHIIAKMT